jgi:adenosylmethionine-8-amino-7-oxononanoate aminotransferase
MNEHPDKDHIFYRDPTKSYPEAVSANGVFIYDSEGKSYLDGSGGAVVVSVGHGNRRVSRAMAEQAERLAFSHGSQFTTRPARELAAKLVDLAPPGIERVYFLSGGSEAVETAVKMARQYQVDRGKPSKFKIISRWTSYHGNTLGALALGGHTGRRRHYQPLIQHTPHISPCYCYRCPYSRTPDSCSLECAEELERTIRFEGPESVSAFIAEPVVGATAGALVPRDGYFQRVREICDSYDVLLIVDEVMTGLGRTGRNFGIDHWEVSPDMIVCAKGLSGGYSPVFCTMTTESVHTAIREGSGAFVHGHTYSQNPLSCAAGLTVLQIIEEQDLVNRSARMGDKLLHTLQRLHRFPIVGDIRGIGLFAGIELVRNKKDRAPFDPGLNVSKRIVSRAFEKGLIVYPGNGGADGIRGDHLLLAPPFIIDEDGIKELVDLLEASMEEIVSELGVQGELKDSRRKEDRTP